MMLKTIPEFVEAITIYRLLPQDQLTELTTQLSRFTDPRGLAKYLLQRGWLSVYQVNQLFQGNSQELVVGPYRILDKLGEGGVSQVFKAWDTRRKCVAALKTIRDEYLNNKEAIARFQREIQVISQLSHPNVVKAFDVDMSHSRHYFAMEYVEGTDLGKMVKLSGPLPGMQACDCIRQAALGLQHAHERGLVHRDIKPGNLLVTQGGSVVKILDLGMARLTLADGGQELNRLTMEGVLIGTPEYLPPEQARDPRNVDIRADIYSLGCTFYYILTGQPPFSGKTAIEVIFKHQKSEVSLEALHPGEQQTLGPILKKMMAKPPADRYQTPAEVAAALGPHCRKSPETMKVPVRK